MNITDMLLGEFNLTMDSPVDLGVRTSGTNRSVWNVQQPIVGRWNIKSWDDIISRVINTIEYHKYEDLLFHQKP